MNANIIFTICSNNYLAKAKVLSESVRRHEPTSLFFIFLCDEKRKEIDYSSFADEVVQLDTIEPAIIDLSLKYNLVELNTCLKPRVFEYLFSNRKADKVIFLDPDIKLFNSFEEIYVKLSKSSIVLTPHICSPIPIDNKTPGESMFNNFGIYNLGFIGLSTSVDTLSFLEWWKGHTYKQCFIDVWNGIFVDQLPINHAPIFFKNVEIMLNPGLNMAPWNLHERHLSFDGEIYLVNERSRLTFYHFSSFEMNAMELPMVYYNRFMLCDRPDLIGIYENYNQELKAADHDLYSKIKCRYTEIKDNHIKQAGKNKWIGKLKKLFN